MLEESSELAIHQGSVAIRARAWARAGGCIRTGDDLQLVTVLCDLIDQTRIAALPRCASRW